MKHLKHLLTALLLLVATVATAHDFEVDGIYYNILSEEDRTVAVTDHDDLICDIGNVVIPENVTYNDATYSVTRIGDGAFQNCWGLTSITIPSSVTSIGDVAFKECTSLTSIEIPNSVTSIGESVFDGCEELTSIEIPNSVTSIGDVAFKECTSLTSIEIPNSVTSIGEGAFRYCYGLTSVVIGSGVISIGDFAFFWCSGLTSITSCIPADKLFVPGYDAFGGVDKDICTLYVPYGAKETYAATEGWSDFVNIVELEETTEVTVIKGENGEAGGVYYDLQGRRVENPANGIYIVNGKKVLVK